MAGIAGLISQHPHDARPLLGRMVGRLRYSAASCVEDWTDHRAWLGRVRVGDDDWRAQPIFSQDRSKCILMFGECFGYEDQKAELRRCGVTFEHPESDAEFCLRLYEARGVGSFASLSGSFCLCIYDAATGELLLVSDRLGTRPLFYAAVPDGRLIFATQVSAILECPEVSRRFDEAAALEFVALQRVLGTRTYHLGVRLLPPGSVLRFQAGTLSTITYWQPHYRPTAGSADDYADQLAEVMRRSVQHVMRRGAKVAMLLSGGLDARMVVAAAGGELNCYTFGDYDNPEAQTARRIAEAKGLPFRFMERHPDHYFNMVDRAVEIGNGMHAFNHAHALGFVEAIAAECDVVTHGYVPELLFRGTSLPRIERRILGIGAGKVLDPTLNPGNLPERIFRRGYSLLGAGVSKLLTPAAADALRDILTADARDMISQSAGHAANLYDQHLWPDVYYHARYPSMLFELSLRPFMTERSFVFHNEVIDLHLQMPVELRANNDVWLKALHRLHPRIARVADANTGHSPFLPAALLGLAEMADGVLEKLPLLWRLGRGAPTGAPAAGLSPISWSRFDWLVRSHPRLRELITDTLSDPEALAPELFDREGVNGLLADHLANRGQHRVPLFALLTLGRWRKLHGCP